MNIEEIKIILLKSDLSEFINALDSFNVNEHDNFGNNILHYYLKHVNDLSLNFKDIFEVVLDKGLSIDDKQSKGQFQRSCLSISVVLNLRDVFDFLINKGANINSVDANGNSILNAAVFNYSKDTDNYGYYIEELLKYGADPFLRNKYDVSAYSLAESIANTDVKKFFIGIEKPH